jgi:bacterial/archaeal transporter family protein
LVCLALLSAVFAALTAVFARIGIRNVDSDLATLTRTAVIIVLLAAFVPPTGKWSNLLALSARTSTLFYLLATGTSWRCYFRALQIGEVAKVVALDKLSVVLVAVFAFAFLGERPVAREWIGILLITAGVFFLG